MLRVVLVVLVFVWPFPARAEPSSVSQAETVLHRLAGERDALSRFQIADEAQALCEKAIAENPKSARPHLILAQALTVADLVHPEACRPGRCERAVEELKKARVLDGNGIEAEHIASELGIVLSRVGNFADALVEYDRALRLVESERRPNLLEDSSKAV